MTRDERLALIEDTLDAALARLVTAETGYTEGERMNLQGALDAVRELRKEGK